MEKFDPQLPYNEIMGQPGLAFIQDGKTFNARGEIVTSEMAAALKPVDSIKDGPTPDDNTIPRCYLIDDMPKQENQPAIVSSKSFETMHWKHLQIMLKTYGEEYKDRESAIRFLTGKK